MLLSAALIVKNEERFLPACLKSLAPVVDEIVVVDTGSTDATRGIAEQHGARVHELAWTGDFSAARNRALDLARGEWILYIDADERLRPSSPSGLRARLGDPAHAGYNVQLYPRPGFTSYSVLRLFRNEPEIRFRGVIHENIWPAIDEYCSKTGFRVGDCNLELDHEGYEGDQGHKHARNLPLLLKAVEQDPRRVYCWCHLADIHLALGDPQAAERAWWRAIGIVRRRAAPLSDDSLPYTCLIQHLASNGGVPGDLIDEALRRFPLNPQLHWLGGRASMRAERFFGSDNGIRAAHRFWRESGFRPHRRLRREAFHGAGV